MREFLELRLGAENIDRLPGVDTLIGTQRADYIHSDRNIIIELKSLADDRVSAAQKVIDRWRRRPDWPLMQGELTLGDILKLHPLGEQLAKEVIEAINRSVVRAFENANRQIRDTKVAFARVDPMGV